MLGETRSHGVGMVKSLRFIQLVGQLRLSTVLDETPQQETRRFFG
jgi:hypothetical protein